MSKYLDENGVRKILSKVKYLSDGSTGTGTSDYNQLTNKPSINGIRLSGNKSLSDLGIQALGNYANASDIPTRLSQLTNDRNYLTEVPTEYKTKNENDDLYQEKGNYIVDNNYVHTDNNYTTTEKSKLASLENYVLPTASKTVIGGIKVGANLTIDSDGTLNANASGEDKYDKILYNFISKDEIVWRAGSLNYNTGGAITATNRIRMGHARFVKAGSKISVNNGYKFNIVLYNEWHVDYHNYLSGRSFSTEPFIIEQDCYVRIAIARNDDAELITNDEINELGLETINNLNIYFIDKDLKEEISLMNKYINKVYISQIYSGNLDTSTGNKIDGRPARARSNFIEAKTGCYILMNNYIYDYSVFYYDDNKNYLNEYETFKNGKIPTIIEKEKCGYIKLAFRGIDTTASLEEKLDDINKSLFVYTPTDVTLKNIGSPADANIVGEKLVEASFGKFNLANKSVNYPLAWYPTDFTFDEILKYRDTNVSGISTNNTQGLCSDGKRYIWFTCNHTDTTNCGLVKYDVINEEVANEVCNHEYGHANGMTYIKDKNQLYITSWITNVNSSRSRVSIVDADTLEFIEEIDLENKFNIIDENYAGIGAVAYSYLRKKIVYLLRPMAKTDGTYKGFIICDLENNILDSKIFKRSAVSGGIGCDEYYIYYVCGNKLYIYDWNLNELGNTTYNIYPNDTYEPEGIAKINDVFFFNYNKSSYANIFTGKPTNFNYFNVGSGTEYPDGRGIEY